MDEKYCIKRTKMNKKGHFAYNLGIWLGLLRVSYGFDSCREYQKADTDVSAFVIPPENRTAVDTARFPYARQARCYTGVPEKTTISCGFLFSHYILWLVFSEYAYFQ